MKRLLYTLSCLWCLGIALGASLSGKVVSPDGTPLRLEPDSRILLDQIPNTWIRADGTFDIQELVPSKSYVLSVDAKDHVFPEYLVHVLTSTELAIKPFKPAEIVHDSLPLLPQPLVIVSQGSAIYVEPKKPFSLKSAVMSNPIVLLMAGAAAMVYLLPKLMNSIDPEALKEMTESQAQMQKQMQSGMDLAGGLSSFLAGGSGSVPFAGAEAGTSAGKTAKRSEGSTRKRK